MLGPASEAWHLLHRNEDSFCRYRSLSELGFFRGLWHCVAQPQTELSHVQFAYAGLAGAMLDDQDARAADFVPITNNRGHERGAAGAVQDDEVGGGDGFHCKSVFACRECRALPAHLSGKCETAVECILGDSGDRVCANELATYDSEVTSWAPPV